MTDTKKTAVAMSGGVDSAMAALLLREQGRDIIGITAVLFSTVKDVSSLASVKDAMEVARRFGFPLEVADLRKEFSDIVVDPFCREYLRGNTPNPCIECNVLVKFSLLYELAAGYGCGTLATGHYARINSTPDGRKFLSMNRDPSKDQSYFLYRMTGEQLDRTIFPLGEYTKTEIIAMARERGLDLSSKPESQEICFIPHNDYPRFIESRCDDIPGSGDIVDRNGTVIGRHRGIHRYTIGQRRGLGISSRDPLYVTGIDCASNRIIAGGREELAVTTILVGGISHMKSTEFHGIMAMVKTRSTQRPARARLVEKGEGIEVLFDEPQYGISPGQSAVFYDAEGDVLGGGYIEGPVPLQEGSIRE